MSGQRLLITGAAGFVGAATVRAALERGDEVIALVRRSDAPRLTDLRERIVILTANLSDTAGVADVLRAIRPDVVIHSAWEGVGGDLRAGDVQLDNIRTTVALADAVIAAGARKFVGIGSQAEYGRYDRPVSEADLPQPTLLYGAAKLAAYHVAGQRCREAGIDFAWMRLFAAYGPSDNPNWLIPSVAATLLRGDVPRCTPGTQNWDYLHIDDVARAITAVAATAAATGPFNLSSGDPVAVRTIIETLRDLAAPGRELRFGELSFGPDQIMHLEGNNARLRALTGWSPQVPLASGLAGVVNNLREAA